MTQPKLLNDDQVREFIANGFLRLTPDVPPDTHKEVDALLRFAVEREAWYGNNILARVPKMHDVLNCPVVRGALTSIAGPGSTCIRIAPFTTARRWKMAPRR